MAGSGLKKKKHRGDFGLTRYARFRTPGPSEQFSTVQSRRVQRSGKQNWYIQKIKVE
jgi:hypothetical protein